ncbi:hypothetical protein HXX76_013671 [Chlamydomonas incerta]|uniref:SET domain-containing protein n=1 Tax=Chlamydomonas incerta TaxID=51695 RepID=A0A835SH56_CHLIN|nr:hypothetical protein HXX76_013671 [Chlamydomonas incerta]|eukprot:KAG2425461.1 hypothetical protein HXX76_013671 [Chlamydomonas incerta]
MATSEPARTLRLVTIHAQAKRVMFWTQLDSMLAPEVAAELRREGRAVRTLRDSEGRKYTVSITRGHEGVPAGPAVAGVEQHQILIFSNDNGGSWSELLGRVLPSQLGASQQRVQRASASAQAVLQQYARDEGLSRGTHHFTGLACNPVPDDMLQQLRMVESGLTIFELPLQDPRRLSKHAIARGVRNTCGVQLPDHMLVARYSGFVVSEADMPAGHAGNGNVFNKSWTHGPIMLPRRSGGQHPGLYLLGDSMGASIGPMINEAAQPDQANCAFTLMLSVSPPQQCALWIGIFTTRPIAPGMELLTTYGR